MKEFIGMTIAIFMGGTGVFCIYVSVMIMDAVITKTLP